MRYLLDTHIFLWWIEDDPRLSARARDLIVRRDTELYLSAASGWEIAIKAQLGKLKVESNLSAFVVEQLSENMIQVLPIFMSHALRVYDLPMLHRDPFDRLLVAQSQLEKLPIITTDPLIAQYDVETLI